MLNEGRPDHDLAFRTVDFRLEKIFKFGDQQRVSLAGEAFNIFNYTNDACYEGFIPPLPEVNPNFGEATCAVQQHLAPFPVRLAVHVLGTTRSNQSGRYTRLSHDKGLSPVDTRHDGRR